MFKRDRILGIRTLLLIVFAVLLMVCDGRNFMVQRAKAYMAFVVSPIQYVVHFPIAVVNAVSTNLSTHRTLLKENVELRAEVLLLQAKLQQQYAIEGENKQLRALLQSSIKVKDNVTEAQLLAVDMHPFMRQIVIDKGSKHGVFVGQPVLDAYGVMGQVVHVAPYMSQVMLLTDANSDIPVQDNRNNVRAIAVGDPSSGMLRLRDVTSTTDIQVGDLFVSSGLGQCYPFGYPVGKVIVVENNPGEQFLYVLVKPIAHINRSRLVLLVQSEKANG